MAAPRGRTASDPRIQRAIRYLEDHLTQKITLQQLATQAGLSREYFCTLFHQQTGKTVFAYLRWARIQLAKEMLAATENSLAAIASLLGFSSQSHFQRAFREVEGCTPFLYRRRAWREQGEPVLTPGATRGASFSQKKPVPGQDACPGTEKKERGRLQSMRGDRLSDPCRRARPQR